MSKESKSSVPSTVEISQNFVAFSEYMNFNFIPLHSVFRILDKCIAVFNEAQKRDRKEIVKTATILALSQQASSSCENMKQTRFFSTWLQKVKIKVKIS